MELKAGRAEFEPVATMRTKYGRHGQYTYTGRVFIIKQGGPDRMPGVNDYPLEGTLYDAWRDLSDWIRLEPLYGAYRARYVYDPGYGFRNKIFKARQEGEVAWD